MAALFLAGCETDNAKYSYDPLAQNAAPASSGGLASTAPMVPPAPVDASGTTMHIGDSVTFNFSDVPADLKPFDDTVKEDGSVTLMYNEKFQADGKTIGSLQQEIHDRYVPKYYRYLTVTIKPQERFYYVGGEVRSPNRQVYTGRMTVLQAIDTAGGFTEFARKGKVHVTRANGQTFDEDCIKALKHPELDHEIFAGDKIQVVKRPW
ncbi:MAG TPA: SLBB domain-containing protein [Verrucomicrobiae bacterium]|nr:SLBB domain-containing protein [Verrucomicrobiae bacterium]